MKEMTAQWWQDGNTSELIIVKGTVSPKTKIPRPCRPTLRKDELINNINIKGFPVAQMVEHGASNAKIMGSIPRESKSW